jgi:hypothetical protein
MTISDRGQATREEDTMNAPDAPLQASDPPLHRHHLLRTSFGVVLFVAWVALTFLWIAATVHEVAHGDGMAAVTAVCALALLVVLCLMEGLEVSVIDRWEKLWPGRPTSYLAGWLAARQLFVAAIVTTATLLAKRSVIVIPGSSTMITSTFWLSVADLTWTTLTVLWFAQIFPKHLGAINPDRYLQHLRGPLFPVVDFVHKVGVSQPGEWAADAVEYWLDWSESPEDALAHPPGHEKSAATIWRHLRRGPHHRRWHARAPRTR